ncbi:KH 1 domain containing protein [Trichuris trichiura]|uniref:KH 1 domain containing protein n=1 Tax=Trichuris trichiura TaxID=36087 RepID=A0A077ZIB7_TRITR|nr:KH 1 domain containing protein [Trichuris trichiura]
MKRYMDDTSGSSSGGGRKRPRSSDGPELRILIPSKWAGAIIGKGGENIKRLRTQYNSTLSIPDSLTRERVVKMSCADLDMLCDCIADILPSLEESNTGQMQHELRILVHQSQAGAIIGRAGFKIKELRESTGSSIRVFSECAPYSTERVIQLTGEVEQVVRAVKEILKICEETPIKGAERMYDANNFDELYPYDYGGYGEKGKRSSMDSSKFMGSPVPVDWFQRSKPRFMEPEIPMRTLTEIQVTIPNELCGTIIGRGGERINRIRNESGAHIRVDPPDANSDQRIITITGLENQVKMGQFLLQQCVRASSAGRKYIQQQLLTSPSRFSY